MRFWLLRTTKSSFPFFFSLFYFTKYFYSLIPCVHCFTSHSNVLTLKWRMTIIRNVIQCYVQIDCSTSRERKKLLCECYLNWNKKSEMHLWPHSTKKDTNESKFTISPAPFRAHKSNRFWKLMQWEKWTALNHFLIPIRWLYYGCRSSKETWKKISFLKMSRHDCIILNWIEQYLLYSMLFYFHPYIWIYNI